MEVVCGPCVLVVVHRRRKDHGKDLQLSQPVLEAEIEETRRRRMGRGGRKQREGGDKEEERDKKRSTQKRDGC